MKLKIDLLYGKEHYELFKWCAVKCWRDEWFKPTNSFSNFAERFATAKKEFSLFIDNSRMHPSAGVIKLWETEPETVENLFNDVLFADIHSDVNATQQAMDRFLYEYEQLRQRHFPGNWSYKQDRHSASVLDWMRESILMKEMSMFRHGTMRSFSKNYRETDADIRIKLI